MLHRYLLCFLWGMLPLSAMAQPVEFIRNDGQWAGPFRYKASAGNGDVFLGPGRDGAFPAVKAGLSVTELSGEQKAKVIHAIRQWVRVADESTAKKIMKG